jgi:type IV secretory pathway TraG/TraD family ATPase VirD4
MDYHSAEHVSRLLGERTVRWEYTSRRPVEILVTSMRHSEHQTVQRLLTSDDVRWLRQDGLLVVCGNRKPVQTKRWCWQRPPVPARAMASGPARLQPVAAAVAAAGRGSETSLRDRLRALDKQDDE